jgi:hypothetical protein
MKSFLDLDLSRIEDKKFKSLKKSNIVVSEPTEDVVIDTPADFDLQSVAESLKEASIEHPYDKGLKYARAQVVYLAKQLYNSKVGIESIHQIIATSQERFPNSSIGEFGATQLMKLSKSNQIDPVFLSKVARLITSQEDYEVKLKQLAYDQMDVASIEARKFLCMKVNEHLGEDVVNNLTYEMEESSQDVLNQQPAIERLMENDSFVDTFTKLCKVTEKIGVDVVNDPKVFDLIDFTGYKGAYKKFGVRTPEYQVLDSLSDEDWNSYRSKMGSSNLIVEYNADDDVFEVHSISSYRKRAEDPKPEEGTTTYKYSPEIKAPAKMKKDIIHPLEGQGKEALTKIWNRTEKSRELKDKAAESQAQLTKDNNLLAKEKEAISEDLENYLKFADAAFLKMELAIDAAYSLKTQEGVILAAIHAESKDVPIDPKEKIIPVTRSAILAHLDKMGEISEEMVKRAEKQLNEMNSAVRTVKSMTKTIYTWPPSQEDIKKMEKGSFKTAGVLDKFIDWAKKSVASIKGFFTSTNKLVDSFLNEYQKLQTLLEQ